MKRFGVGGVAVLTLVWLLVHAIPRPAAAQHAHHGGGEGGAQVALAGTVLGAEGEPLSGAVVRLLHGSGPARHLMASTVTDAAGRFTVRAGSGSYDLEILHLGHEPHRRPVTLVAAPLNVGRIRMEVRPLELEAVTANVERLAVELRSGATRVNVQASPAAGGSIADLLRTVPGVELDADGRIGVRGSTGVLVLVDGQRIALTGDALAAFLRQMPAAALERVEVGTGTSARQGPDGAAGVVNLVFRTHSGRPTAMRSLAGSMASDDHYVGSAAAAGSVADVLSWDLMYSLSDMRPHTASRTARWSLVPGDLPLTTEQESRVRERHRLHSVLAGAAASPTPNTSVTLRGTFAWMEGAYRSRSAFLYTNAEGFSGSAATGTHVEHVIPSGEMSASASIGGLAVRFTTEARVSFVQEDLSGAYFDEDAGYRYAGTVTDSRVRGHGLRNDLGLRLAAIALDVGHEARLRSLTATHDAAHFGATESRAFHHEEAVHAGYLTARRTWGGLWAEGGLRVEADRTRTGEESAGERREVRLFPAAGAAWRDPRGALLYRFAYGRRVNRPGAEMLNPFAMGGDDMNEAIGNPALRAEVTDQMEFGIERHRPRMMLQVTPFIRWTRDPIRPLKVATESGGATTTRINLERARAVGADGSVRLRPAEGVVVTVVGTAMQMESTGDGVGSRGLHATTRLTLDLHMGANTTVQLYTHHRSAQAIEQGEILPVFTSEVALTQRLAGDRARVTLRLSDPLRGDRLEYRIAGATFTQETGRHTARPLLSLFASYAVGGAPREDMPVRREAPAGIF